MKDAYAIYHHDNKFLKEVARMNRKVLRRCGAYVRKIARDFVRHRSNPDEYSDPLSSPYDHFGLKKSIVFASDDNEALIGPRYIKRGLNNVARLHEFGGTQKVKDVDSKLLKKVNVGDTAPVRSRMASKDDRAHSSTREIKKDPKTGQDVIWIRIRTKSQAEHATRLYRRLAGKTKNLVTAKYPPRPYMLPAITKSLPYLPMMWREALGK